MTQKLFEPIQIGPALIKNRVAMAPMNCLYATPDGHMTEQEMAHYAARAKGGTGLIITGAVLGTRMAAKFPFGRNLNLWHVSHLAGMAELTQTVHYFGAKIFIQLSIGFGNKGHTTIDGEQPYAPSPIPYAVPPENFPKGFKEHQDILGHVFFGEVPREMTIEEIKSEQKEYADSARLAVSAGFDGIEIHAPHGYLEHQFLSPKFNKRTDEYGGSLENRMRFLLETCQAVKDSVGNSVAVGVRVSADEHRPGGFTYEDVKVLVKRLEDLGMDFLHLSDGSYEAADHFIPGKDSTHMLEEAKGFKELVDMPVITPSIHSPDLAESAINEGMTDMISMGRQSLADPEWANKAQAGRTDEITKCVRCNACFLSVNTVKFVRCAVNPNVGRERYMPEYWRGQGPRGKKTFPPEQIRTMIKEKGGLMFFKEPPVH